VKSARLIRRQSGVADRNVCTY